MGVKLQGNTNWLPNQRQTPRYTASTPSCCISAHAPFYFFTSVFDNQDNNECEELWESSLYGKMAYNHCLIVSIQCHGFILSMQIQDRCCMAKQTALVSTVTNKALCMCVECGKLNYNCQSNSACLDVCMSMVLYI